LLSIKGGKEAGAVIEAFVCGGGGFYSLVSSLVSSLTSSFYFPIIGGNLAGWLRDGNFSLGFFLGDSSYFGGCSTFFSSTFFSSSYFGGCSSSSSDIMILSPSSSFGFSCYFYSSDFSGCF